MRTKTLRYESAAGYTGVLYGESSFSVYDPAGDEVLHTGFRSFDTYEELVKAVDNFPALIEALKRLDLKLLENDDEEV